MGKPPAIVIVARHGARLDAEDSQWQSFSSAPYNTPLTYGGWTQCRALGARIASILHARDLSLTKGHDDAPSQSQNENKRSESAKPQQESRRKRKIVVHTSPFLRCVQSSIGISSGIAQYQGNLSTLSTNESGEANSHPHLYTGNHAKRGSSDTEAQDEGLSRFPSLKRISEDISNPEIAVPEDDKTTLRVDACLGEWLSPDYYEFTARPPSSNMMVAGAKADLMRSSEPLQGAKILRGTRTSGRPSKAADSSTMTFEDLANALPDESGSRENGNGRSDSLRPRAESDYDEANDSGAAKRYIPPTPMYAVSPSGPIPTGYVDHARDACVKADLCWDSMREPQLWGDGGPYGEEWSAMHRRFRSGLYNMVEWYRKENVNKDSRSSPDPAPPLSGDAHDSEDTVLVIVTHGAGCNALIGGFTNQPVLMDVGLASLTLGVRRNHPLLPQSPIPERMGSGDFKKRRGSSSAVDSELPLEYELLLVANSDHLRTDPLKIPSVQSARSMPPIAESLRRTDSSDYSGNMSPNGTKSNGLKNSSLGSFRRRPVRPYSSSISAVPPQSPSGLWAHEGGTMKPTQNDIPESGLGTTPTTSAGSQEVVPADGPNTPRRHQSVSGGPKPNAKSPNGQGLWGSSSGKVEGRRRWTTNER
ncbi:MAG: hypothetical protein M1831_002120 [Alyxoria varia]|nr:MAG: hypothetical protein M1831_002120 [Alyxoria varia]